MNGKHEKYIGNSYEFTLGKCIGRGGNGKVFKANILNPQCKKKYVVKILSMDKWPNKKMKELRYKRFHKEIHKVLELQNNIIGVMEILDFHCPDKMPVHDKVWYIMYEAETFRKFSNYNCIDIKTKLKYLLELANIIDALHEKGCSHRDIKIDNLLILDNKLMLSDFGLIWNIDDARITGEDERLGPYYIGPPELENRDIDMDDFRPSDVYLYAKVVWMVLKNDNIGFRGQYKRDNKQFYLRSEEYGVTTFEPIHILLEKSTGVNMNERIDIKECSKLISEQLLIMTEDSSNSKASSYRFEELKREMVNEEEPNERRYSNFDTILKILEKFISISNIIIEGANEIINVDLVKQWKGYRAIIFESKLRRQTFLCYPDYIKYSNGKDRFELHIKKVEREEIHSEFISYKENKRAKWGNINNNIFLDEFLVICFEKRII